MLTQQQLQVTIIWNFDEELHDIQVQNNTEVRCLQNVVRFGCRGTTAAFRSGGKQNDDDKQGEYDEQSGDGKFDGVHT